MYIWNSTKAIAFIFLLLIKSVTAATVCTEDLNGDGAMDAPGESATCLSTGTGELCPISAVACNTISPTCPIDKNLSCDANNQCTKPQACINNSTTGTLIYILPSTTETVVTPFSVVTSMTIIDQYFPQCIEGSTYGFIGNTIGVQANFCRAKFLVTGEYGKYDCPLTGARFVDNSTCVSACSQTKQCTVKSYACPTGAFACQSNSGVMQCSPNTCTDLSLVPPVVVETDTRMLVDDGKRAADGTCIEEINIFAGRPMDCKVAGVGSAYQNCCSKGDAIIQDNIGGYQSAELAINSIAAIGTATAEAYVAYSAYTAAGATSSVASTAGALAFENAMLAAGPTLIYAAAAIVVINYVANACTAGDLETSSADASGMCSYVGKRCTEKWAGNCVQKVKVFCCFNTKLGRIIHDQGRKQLKSYAAITGGVYGVPESPACRGFKPEEFQALDFSQIDMSEYFGDLNNAAATTINVNNKIQKNIDEKINALP